ncbi:MAG: DoxX family protein [Sphingomonadaceae bacterium]|nr:DoxX family protein [Sphingomonadaceae bacterium]
MNWSIIPASWSGPLLSVLRIVAGLLLLAHGVHKFFNFPAPFPFPLNGMMYAAGVIELVGGALLMLGLATRLSAFVCSGFAAAAYWIGHAPQSPFPVANGGDAAILFCFVFLYIAAAGPGPWSVDAMRAREPVT